MYNKLLIVVILICMIPFGTFALKVDSAAPFSKVKTVQGEVMDLASISKDKVILLDFFTTWCKPCAKELPILQAIHEKYGPRGFTVIGVSNDVIGQKNKVIPFVKGFGVDFPILHDETGNFAKQFGVKAYPTSFIIDKSGIVKLIHTTYKPGDEKEFYKMLDELLPETEAPAATE